MNYCNHAPSVVRRPSVRRLSVRRLLTFALKAYSSLASSPFTLKLFRNDPWVML